MASALLESPLHRIPTLWSLYRPLLRATRSVPLELQERKALYGYIRDGFKRSKKLGNVEKVKRKWIEAEQLLTQLEGCSTSTTYLERTRELARYLVSRSSLPLHPPPPLPASASATSHSDSKCRERPSILHATQFSPSMLRIRPQPIGTSMMIFNRRRKSQKRFDQLVIAREYVEMMREEERFERRTKGGNEGGRKWGGEWIEWIKDAKEKERREQTRNNMRITEELQARANKLNKEREQRRRRKSTHRAMIRSTTKRLICSPPSTRPRLFKHAIRRPEPNSNKDRFERNERYLSSSRVVAGEIKEFKLADIGEGITECEIVKWLVKPGETITEFDPVAEVQSDKASVEITSPFSGTITSVAGDVGDMLKVGATLCRVELEGGEEEGVASATQETQSQPSTAKAPSSPSHSTSSGSTITKQFKLADIGEGITECEIVKWHVKPGGVIEEFDPIVEVTSDKASVEITSPFSGKIESLAGGIGEMLKVGSTLCEIEVVATPEKSPALSTESPTGKTTAQEEIPHPVRPDPRLGSSSSVLATPATRRFARELSVDLTRVTPTGRDGRVTKGDVLEFSKQTQGGGGETKPFIPFERPPIDTSGPLPTSSSPSSSSESISLSPTRRAMFKAMTQSLQIPHFAYSETIDVTLLERLRTSLNSNIPLEYRKTLTPQDAASIERTRQWQSQPNEREDSSKFDRITLLPLLIKSLSIALNSHPLFLCTHNKNNNAEPTLTRRSNHDISLAVSSPSPSGGLFTPVLLSIETQSIFSIASQLTHLQSFVSSTQGIPKFPSQFQGNGTITLSNIGAIGGRTTHPVIPPTGQLAIGAMGRVRVEPRFANEERAKKVAREELLSDEGGGLKVEPRLVMDVTFSADHRVVEGVELARLVETWKNVIEDPTRLLI
ncbi:uncharacterized protein JCM6883_005563 [Sporobolomyces salmoneus]|uniref:uncharacterized protein n=1 Tax=Sporobolomyces salmoneus TaxID=183962 RepID=UPI00318247FA